MSLADTSILEAIEIPQLWQPWFKDPATWARWRAFLKTVFGLPMTESEFAFFQECTGREMPDPAGYLEAWLICGRRSGKSFILALIASYLAVFKDWREHLTPGEVATIMVLASDRKQARTIFRFCRALLTRPAPLRVLVERETADTLELRNDVTIEIHTASYSSVRGYSVAALLIDELAFFPTDTEAASPDEEVIAAARPAMASIPNAMMLVASSPYARRGCLWDAFREHYGEPSPVLVWRAATWQMNPTIPENFVAAQYRRDPASAAAEYGAEFRTDVETFVSREVVEAAIIPGRFELPPASGTRYTAFVDPSGGSADSMTLAIGHLEGDAQDLSVLDAVREVRPPFSPESVVEEFARLLRKYRIATVVGDRYGGEWPAERFREHGIEYRPAQKSASDLYIELLPLLNSRRIELLDHPRLTAQLCALERKAGPTGKDLISHPPMLHDDIVNAVAGLFGDRPPPGVRITAEMVEAVRRLSPRRRW